MTCDRPLFAPPLRAQRRQVDYAACLTDSGSLDLGFGLMRLFSSQINNALVPPSSTALDKTIRPLRKSRARLLFALLLPFHLKTSTCQQKLIIMQLLTTVLGALSAVVVVAASQPNGNDKGMFYISPSGESYRLTRQQQQSLVSSNWPYTPLIMCQFQQFHSCAALPCNRPPFSPP